MRVVVNGGQEGKGLFVHDVCEFPANTTDAAQYKERTVAYMYYYIITVKPY